MDVLDFLRKMLSRTEDTINKDVKRVALAHSKEASKQKVFFEQGNTEEVCPLDDRDNKQWIINKSSGEKICFVRPAFFDLGCRHNMIIVKMDALVGMFKEYLIKPKE